MRLNPLLYFGAVYVITSRHTRRQPFDIGDAVAILISDSCFTSPCVHGGRCRYTGLCSCLDVNLDCGFHDEICQRQRYVLVAAHYCDVVVWSHDCSGDFTVDRCQQMPECSLRQLSYECDCTETGYEGVNCQSDVNECQAGTHSCMHGSL